MDLGAISGAKGWESFNSTSPLVRSGCRQFPVQHFSSSDHEAMAAALDATGRYRVLRRLTSRSLIQPYDGTETRLGLFVDVETTGLDPSRDEIIELAMVRFIYGVGDRRRAILRRQDEVNAFIAGENPDAAFVERGIVECCRGRIQRVLGGAVVRHDGTERAQGRCRELGQFDIELLRDVTGEADLTAATQLPRPPPGGRRCAYDDHADGIAAMDLFVVPTISFRLLYGLLIMGHGRRQILWFGVTPHPIAAWIANQLTEACGWEQAPRYLIHDRDRAYGEVFVRRLRSIGIRDRPASPRSPWQNGHAERLIGSIRRECL
jgi:transposase InsO family protein